MLVLSRKVGEQISVGDSIILTVVEVDRGKIRLGIDAPGLRVSRRELVSDAEWEEIVRRSLLGRDEFRRNKE